jgi:hypothetical protein
MGTPSTKRVMVVGVQGAETRGHNLLYAAKIKLEEVFPDHEIVVIDGLQSITEYVIDIQPDQPF